MLSMPGKGARIHTFVPSDSKHIAAVRKMTPDNGSTTIQIKVFIRGAGKTEVVSGNKCHQYDAFMPPSFDATLTEKLKEHGITPCWSYQYQGTDQYVPAGAPSAQITRECKSWKGGWMWMEETVPSGQKNIYWEVPEDCLVEFSAFVAGIREAAR